MEVGVFIFDEDVRQKMIIKGVKIVPEFEERLPGERYLNLLITGAESMRIDKIYIEMLKKQKCCENPKLNEV